MNAPPFTDPRATAAIGRDSNDDRMDQIRELLVGEQFRLQEARLQALETRLRELEGLVFRRVDSLTARLETLAGETGADRRQSFEDLSRMMFELSENIRRLSRGP